MGRTPLRKIRNNYPSNSPYTLSLQPPTKKNLQGGIKKQRKKKSHFFWKMIQFPY